MSGDLRARQRWGYTTSLALISQLNMMPTRRIWLLALAVISLGVALWIIARGGAGDRIMIERPEWMRPPSDSLAHPLLSAESAPVAKAESSGVSARTATEAMAPCESLSEALSSGSQRVQFSAVAMVDSGLAKDIADGMVRAAQNQWFFYQDFVKKNTQGQLRAELDFFYALWPELGGLIRDKKVTPSIVALPQGSKAPRFMINYFYHTATDELDVFVNTDIWQVKMSFGAEGNPCPVVFAAIKNYNPPGSRESK